MIFVKKCKLLEKITRLTLVKRFCFVYNQRVGRTNKQKEAEMLNKIKNIIKTIIQYIIIVACMIFVLGIDSILDKIFGC